MVRKNKNGEIIHEQHLLMSMEMHHKIDDIIIDFNMFQHNSGQKKVHRFNASTLIRILLQSFINQYNSSDDPNSMIMEMLTYYNGA